jgi:hypothetical protein
MSAHAADIVRFTAGAVKANWMDRGYFSGTVAVTPSDGDVLASMVDTLRRHAPLSTSVVMVSRAVHFVEG